VIKKIENWSSVRARLHTSISYFEKHTEKTIKKKFSKREKKKIFFGEFEKFLQVFLAKDKPVSKCGGHMWSTKGTCDMWGDHM
jgi:hypothetical protein